MQEQWKDINGFEGKYQISNFGRVKSLDRKVLQFNGIYDSYRLYKGKILKKFTSNRGYEKVILYDKKGKKTVNVHRIVAEAFIPNPKNLPQVNHIDENKRNNCISNLEWCDSKYNINYGSRNQKTSKALKNVAKSEEHKKKLSIIAKKRVIIRNDKGQFVKSNKEE